MKIRRNRKRRDGAELAGVRPAPAPLILAAASLVLLGGCARTLGNFYWPDKCESAGRSASDDLELAPMWVPGSHESARVGTSSCKAHLAPDDFDRLCAVGAVDGIASSDLAMSTAIQAGRRDLEQKVRAALVSMLDGTPPGGGKSLDTLAFEIADATGKVADTWVSPNCDAYALTELELDHFLLLIEPADVSGAARSRIEAGARDTFLEE
jgi:hypothetical protein